MEHLLNQLEDHFNQHKNSHNQCNEIGHPVLSLMENQWNLRQTHNQIFPWRASHCRTNTNFRRKEEIQKSRTVRFTVR